MYQGWTVRLTQETRGELERRITARVLRRARVEDRVEAALAARLPNVPTQAPTIRRDVERSLPDRPAEPGGEPVRRQAHGIAKGDTPASSPKGE
ncbi:MAG: hypothetical protein ACM35G_03875 [Planctomycetaceae bacterium]